MNPTDLSLAAWAGLLGLCLAAALAVDRVFRAAATDRLTERSRRRVRLES